MTINKNNFKPAYISVLIAAALSGMSQQAYSRDYFNPELIELDNPGTNKTDLSAFENGSQ
ncbi:TPA: hypothetical protein R1R37_005179, partial [Klebsiella aerogenes]|nr:hypothetical protein [Klebsiella aerogenes]